MIRHNAQFPAQAAVPPRDYKPVALVGRPCTYRTPAGFDQVDGIKCASPNCGSRVHFVHRRTRLCLACATKAGIVLGSVEDAGLRGAVPSASDEQVAKRIALAHQIREMAGPEGTILPLLEDAMEGPEKNARRNGQRAEQGVELWDDEATPQLPRCLAKVETQEAIG